MEKSNTSLWHHPIEINRRMSRLFATSCQFDSLFSADYISNDNTLELGNCLKRHHHPCANSNTFIEEQTLPWLDELLKEPDSPVICSRSQHHQRSISDSFPYYIEQEKSPYEFKAPCKYHIWHDHHRNFILEAAFPVIPTCIKQHSQVSDAPIPDAKRTKQQMAQSARTRKLQCISELERNVQILQAEKTQMLAQLQYQQFLIFGTENRALKQRLDTLPQKHLLKNLEQNMQERELGRLQFVYNQKQHQQNQCCYSRFRRSRSRLC